MAGDPDEDLRNRRRAQRAAGLALWRIGQKYKSDQLKEALEDLNSNDLEALAREALERQRSGPL